MFDIHFPPDKEGGGLVLQNIEKRKDEPETANHKPSTRQTAFLLGLLWLFWLVGIFLDTSVEINARGWRGARLSQLQFSCYSKGWDLWMYRSTWQRLFGRFDLNKMCATTFALCAALMLALMKTLPSRDPIVSSIINVCIALSVAGAAWIPLEGREMRLIAMPLAWLFASTSFVFLDRAGMGNLSSRLQLTPRTLKWCRYGSLALFVLAHWWFYGLDNELIVLWILYQGICETYKRLA
ncbi:hypothetical protein EK21DRAFT_115125 [Setomelanomma holmii]|uniref:Uncharacterized protein n=1 Tax=Setomelanomma holmii TaxID=210430 RepID=A0A9P4LJZ4_9PLEO|nr:hypothetical protein EK21DRAFT_115125 [Setomelanomma holmii]